LTQLLPANETPAITDTSTGNVLVFVHAIRDSNGNVTSGSVDFTVYTRFSGAVTTGLHIHKAAAGADGPIIIPTDVHSCDKRVAVNAAGKVNIVKQVQFPQTGVDVATIADLIANPQKYYVNIHTTDHAGGVS
jgi:hypothetical protein